MKKTINTSSKVRFSRLSRKERQQYLIDHEHLTNEEVLILDKECALGRDLSEAYIENCIGTAHLPIGIAMNFIINNKEYIIPMAVEETSVVASASYIAKWIQQNGELTSEVVGECSIGQIQFPVVSNYKQFYTILTENSEQLVSAANQEVCPQMCERGGGIKELEVRSIDRGDGDIMAVVHIKVNTCDAMGANIITQICEYIRPRIETLTGVKANVAILSNLSDTKITRSRIKIHKIDPTLARSIVEASLFAKIDPYRAATNNKGVMNAIDAILIATGNDWRATNAAIHAYAARNSQYSSITRWTYHNGVLTGVLEAPIPVGVVGGVISTNPVAKICLKMLGADSANQLSSIIGAVGLAQNLGAIKALVSEGLVSGHMRLHIQNFCMAVGAKDYELARLQALLSKKLKENNKLTESDALEALNQLRESTE